MSGRSHPVLAAVWMTGAVVSFTAMAVAGREIQTEMNTFELMMYRSAIGFLVVVALLSAGGSLSQVATRRIDAHVKRNVVHFAAQNFWFYGVAAIPLSQLVALEFTSPIWVAVFSPFLLGERMNRSRVFAAALGFAGVLIVARPGVSPIELGHGAGLLAAVGFALTNIFTKDITRTDSVLCVLFWMTLMQFAFGLVLALPGGIPVPSPGVLPWLAVVGIGGLTAHYCLTSALRAAPAPIVAPLEFMRLPLIAVVGMLVYQEPLVATVFIGATLILGGNIVNVRHERRRQKALG
ncbi:MAG: DMT family transporter [Gammaproteobacteria bacterium]